MDGKNKLITLFVLMSISVILLLILVIVTPSEVFFGNFNPDEVYPTMGVTYINGYEINGEASDKDLNDDRSDESLNVDNINGEATSETTSDANISGGITNGEKISDENVSAETITDRLENDDNQSDEYQNIRPNEEEGVETVIIPTAIPERENVTLNDIIQSMETKYYLIEEFPHLLQNPELPTGCEITSLTMVLNYLGFEVDKMELLDYMPCGSNRKTNPNKAFVGNPRTENGFGCNSPVIAKVAEDFFKSANFDMEVNDLQNCTAEDLFNYILDDTPVIVWANIGMIESTKLLTWTATDGEKIEILNQEHCLVLIGFDIKKKVFLFADPLKEVEVKAYDMARFLRLFKDRGSQAIVIK